MEHTKEIEDAVFEAALGFDDPRQREEFLNHWFRGDAEGLERIQRLLTAAEESTSFFLDAREARMHLARDVADEIFREEVGIEADGETEEPAFRDKPGASVGPYRLIDRIGEGGCGVVYEAEQVVPFRRQVALKIIRLGMDTESVIARFELERQALAMMDHRNIASVFDAGATQDGRPYFVMELVKGERITEHCDVRKMPPAERLAMFLEVCEAIQHAHLKGVIHRDIKPSNILVRAAAEGDMPKVIDFGIAKATSGRSAGATVLTGHDQLLGTPAYMSPEQVDLRGIDVDTRSDVYSLGVLLYELLAGVPPFDGETLMESGISNMRRVLLEVEPPLPSKALVAAGGRLEMIASRRGMEPARLVDFIKGDLDAIVMKAMEKDRTRRYQTVNSLEMDVKRFLANKPVEARKPGRFYALGKFVRRNRGACISGAALAVSIIAGMAVSLWLYVRESRALTVQARLLKEAKAYQEEKAVIRRQAEDRAVVSRVAVLVSEGKVQEADAFLRANPVEYVEPSREAVEIFRTVGHWSGQHRDWKQALACFRKLDQANRHGNPVAIIESRDLMPLAPLILNQEGVASYNQLRNQILLNYLPVQSTRSAQQVLKVCLLTPVEPEMLEALKDVTKICQSNVAGPNKIYPNPDWEAFSMALYSLRSGNPKAVLEWKEKGMTTNPLSRVCATAMRCLGAHASFQLGDVSGAELALAEVRAILAEPPNSSEYPWTWWDWLIVEILLRETEAAMNPEI